MVRASGREGCSWLAGRGGFCGDTAIEAVDSSGRIRGAVGFDHWAPNSVQVHIALDTPAAWRSLLRPTFQYPFLQAGRGVLLGLIASSNERSVALARAVGFREAHRVRDGYAVGDDILVFEMRRNECRWLETP